MATIPNDFKDLFEGQNFAHLVTLMPDGSPQTTPVWIGIEDNVVTFNTADGRQKALNLDRDPRVALSIHDASNPYRYIQVRGKVIGKTAEGADAHIDSLAKRYMGVDRYPMHTDTETRVKYTIQPERVQTMG